MKKTALTGILAVCICLLFVLGGCSMLPTVTGLKFKNDELRSCSVSTGGGMLGGYSYVTLKKDENGGAVLEIRRKETHADREVTSVYQVDPEAFEKVKEMAIQYDLYAASKRRYSKFQVLDGDTTSVSFSFSNGSFRISDNQVLSKKMSTGFREVIHYLSSLAEGEGVTTVEPQKATLYLKSGYTIPFSVADAFDGKLEEFLEEENEVSSFMENGIVLNTAQGLDVSGSEPEESAAAGTIVYEPESSQIILLYTDYTFEQPVYVLAWVSDSPSSACPLFAEMEGPYRLYFN